MSVEDFDLGDDIDSLLGEPSVAPTPSPRKTTTAKKRTQPVDHTEIPATDPPAERPLPATDAVGEALEQKPGSGVPAEDPRDAEMARLREEMAAMRKMLEQSNAAVNTVSREDARTAAEAAVTQKSPKSSGVDAEAMLAAQTPTPQPKEGTLIHVLTDGVTFGGSVYYQGQELVVPDDHRLATISGAEQVRLWGAVKVGRGPWQGYGYDVDAEQRALTQQERAELAAAVEREKAALANA